MLHLITGTPGSGKTLYAVYLIDKFEIANKLALDYNAKVYKDNLSIIENQDLQHYFFSYTYFCKILKDYVTETFDDSYFGYLSEKIRVRNIFLDIKFYNGIIDKIRNDIGLELKTLKYVRHIYSNIDGLKVDNVQPIEIDWRKCPDGSIIFYDEIQLLYEYSTDNKQDKDSIVKSLTIHRHRAFDIYGITQFPSLVHTNYRAVVGLHYHLHRGWGAKSATVYVWANCRDKPNSLGNKLTAERDFRFNYPKRLYEVYESATADTVKLRVPLKLFLILLIPLFGALMFIFSLSAGSNNFFVSIFGGKKEEVKQDNQKTDNQAKSQDSVATASASTQQPEQMQQLTNVVVSYNPNDPYAFQPDSIPVQIVDYPRLSGCVKYNGKYYGYDQQGNLMNNLQKNACERWLSGDKPFNYSKPPQPQNLQQTTLPVQTVSTDKMTPDEYMKYLEYVQGRQQANNVVVETQTLRQTHNINGANAL